MNRLDLGIIRTDDTRCHSLRDRLLYLPIQVNHSLPIGGPRSRARNLTTIQQLHSLYRLSLFPFRFCFSGLTTFYPYLTSDATGLMFFIGSLRPSHII